MAEENKDYNTIVGEKLGQEKQVARKVNVVAEPLHDRVIIRKILADEKVGLIIVPEAVRENSTKGEVVAVGPGRAGEKMNLGVGDVVMFANLIGTEIEIDGELFLLMREGDIMAVLERRVKPDMFGVALSHVKDRLRADGDLRDSYKSNLAAAFMDAHAAAKGKGKTSNIPAIANEAAAAFLQLWLGE